MVDNTTDKPHCDRYKTWHCQGIGGDYCADCIVTRLMQKVAGTAVPICDSDSGGTNNEN